MSKTDQSSPSMDPSTGAAQTPCLCTALRRASRVMTKRYNRYLRPVGLRVTQYSMLATINRNPGVTVSGLARLLAMDQTTVTRNLQNLMTSHYIRMALQGDDQRSKQVYISNQGKTALDEARPLWHKAQEDMEQALGKLGMDFLLQSLHSVIK